MSKDSIQLIKKAETDAKKMIEQAKQDAESIISSAKQEVSTIENTHITKAKKDVENWFEEANLEAQTEIKHIEKKSKKPWGFSELRYSICRKRLK